MTRTNRADRRDTIQARASALASAGSTCGVQAAATADTAATADSPARTSAELWLYGVVGGYWFGFDAASVAAQLAGLEVDDLTVRLHSPGGDALDGIAIANLLRNNPARVTMVVDGLAASSASIIALAGDEVVMSPGAQIMIHDPWMLTVGSAAELRADAEFLDKQAQNYAGVYAYCAGGTAEAWREVMVAETWFTAAEAVDAGLANRVGTVPSTTPPPAPPVTDPASDGAAAARAAWDLEALVHPAARAAWRLPAPNPPAASAEGSITSQGTESAVAFTPQQMMTMRQELGLPEAADEATIVAALAEALVERADDAPASTTPVAASIPEGMSLVEADVLTSLRDQAAQGAQAFAAQQAERRDRMVTAAISDGKITPARRDHWVAAWSADPEGTEQTLAALAPGLVPVEESGHAGDINAHADGDVGIDDAELAVFAAQLGLSKEALRA